VESLSTGIPPLDELIDGLQFGDNVVWEVDELDVAPFVEAFVRSARGFPVTYVSFRSPPGAVLDRLGEAWEPQHALLLDCFTDGIGRTDPTLASFYLGPRPRAARVERVDAPAASEAVREILAELQLRLGRGARYVFDSVTAMQELWGLEEALSLFLGTCPPLYDLRTAAYWLVDRPAHDASFLASLAAVTQVVLEVTREANEPVISVAKAQGRRNEVVGRRARFSMDGLRVRVFPEGEPLR
jgi:hypothetical protein